jgi:hypothetical protein
MNDPALAAEFLAHYARRLPDGRLLYVAPLLGGRARICIGDDLSVDNGW